MFVLDELCSRLWAWNGFPLNTYISMYARTNRYYNERDSRTNYVRSTIPHCTCSLEWNQNWRDSASVMLLTLRMRRKSWKCFKKWFQGMFPTRVQSQAVVHSCTRVLFWRKYSINDCVVLYFSEIKCFREYFEATTYIKLAYNITQ